MGSETTGNADKNSRYRTKICKYCGNQHKKRGIYCNQSCSNRDRPAYSQKVSENARKQVIEYNKTPAGIARQKLIGVDVKPEDFAIELPTFYDIPEGFDKADDW
jgi:NMD protein affecting ribosome stability and mRNA decay